MNINQEVGRRNAGDLIIAAATGCLYGLAFVTSAAAADSRKLAKELKGLTSGSKINVIVQFRNKPSDADVAGIEKLGAETKLRFKFIRAGVFSLPPAALNSIAANPSVTYISPDRKVSGRLEFAEPKTGAASHFRMGGQDLEWALRSSIAE